MIHIELNLILGLGSKLKIDSMKLNKNAHPYTVRPSAHQTQWTSQTILIYHSIDPEREN